MHRPYVLGLLFALSLVSSVPRAHAADSPTVILSEIAWAGSAQSTADEWIELANIGAESVPLGGWQLTGVGTSDSVLTIPAETVLGAGSTYLISNYALGDPKSTLNIASSHVTTAVSIPNTALNVTLLDATGATVDSLVDPGTPDAGSSATFTSMERVLTDLSWMSAETSTNLLNGQLGSPGIIGHTAAAPIEPKTIEETVIETETPIVIEPVTDPAPVEIDAINEAPTVTEPVVDPVPAIIEDPIAETTPESIIDPVVETPIDAEPIEPTVVSETVEAPIEPAVIPETIETPAVIEEPVMIETMIETPEVVEKAPVEAPVAIEEAPVEAAATIEVAPIEYELEEEAPLATIAPGDVIISGVFPSPNTGDDEWVALTNTTDAVIDLAGITLVDASGAVTILGETIDAQTTIYVLNPKGKLNNESDSISLVDGAGIVIASAEYGTDEFPAPKKGTVLLFSSALIEPETIDAPVTEPYEEPLIALAETTNTAPATSTAPPDLAADSSGARSTRTTVVATTSTSVPPTHSTPNIATRVTRASATASSTKKKSSTRPTSTRTSSSIPKSITIDDISTLSDDTAVTLEGIVIALPGTIGKRSFFLDGLEIYQSQGDLAAVTIGNRVRITGTVSVLSDHRRVNIKTGGVTVLGDSSPIVHEYSDALPYGSLVRVTGTVSARDGNAIVLTIDDEHSIIIAPATGVTVNWADLAGKTISVTGVLKNSNTPSTIVLRNAEDIIVTAQETIEAAAAGTSSSTLPWIAVGAVVLVVAGFGAWTWRNRPQASLTTLTLHPTTI